MTNWSNETERVVADCEPRPKRTMSVALAEDRDRDNPTVVLCTMISEVFDVDDGRRG